MPSGLDDPAPSFIVTLGGESHRFFPGAGARDLVGRLSPADQAAIATGHAFLADRFGDEVGLDGALSPGASYQVLRREPPERST